MLLVNSKAKIITQLHIKFIFFIICGFSCCTLKSQVNLDSLGNLWVITVDKSGSMLWDNEEKYQSSKRFQISKSVITRLADAVVSEMIDFSKDQFFFFNSGILNTTDIEQLSNEQTFDHSFIHFNNKDNRLFSFDNETEFALKLKDQIEKWNYSYRYSFVSLIRIYALIKAWNEIKERRLTDQFNKIYLMTITDDADQNDQWRMDYRRVKKFAPSLFKEVEKDLTQYVYNPLNSNQEAESTGAFELVLFDDSKRTHINIYEYATFASVEPPITDQALFDLDIKTENELSISSNQLTLGDNFIDFIRIDSIITDDERNYYNASLYNETTFSLDIAGSFFQFWKQPVRVVGSAEVEYEDPLLGPRRKRYPINIEYKVFPYRVQAFAHRFFTLVLLIIAGWLIYHLIIRPYLAYFKVYDSIGNEFAFRKGSLSTGFWQKGIFNSMVYNNDEVGRTTVISTKKGRIFRNPADTDTGTFDSLLLVTKRKLQLSPATEEVTIRDYESRVDFLDEMDAVSYPKIFDIIYRQKVPQRFIDYIYHSTVIKGRFQKVLMRLTRFFWYKRFYLVSFQPAELRSAQLVRFGLPKLLSGRAFEVTLSNQDAPDIDKSQAYLNEFYATNRKSDALIILAISDQSIHASAYQTEFRDNLRVVQQIYDYTIKFGDPVTNVDIGMVRRKLRKAMRKGAVSLRRSHCEIIDYRDSGIIGPEGDFQSTLQFPFKLERAPFCSYLFLVENKVGELGKAHLIYSPFGNHQKSEIHLESPDKGSYFVHEGVFPKWEDNLKNTQHQRRLSDESLSFDMKSMITLEFDNDHGTEILLESISIPYKSNG